MKKFSITLLSLFLTAVIASAQVIKGDMNDDGVMDIGDLNESVVKLSGDLILAMGYGTATITCSAADGSGVKAECTVTVKNKVVTHEYVDLGLPGGVLWATCNVGADKPEDYGLYFAWGETTGYAKGESHSFDWNNYRYEEDRDLDAAHDAATANWGADWRMPTLQEIKDLYDSKYTTTEWVTVNGVNGRKITSKSNGNSIFLPAAGCRVDTSLINEGSHGYYWSSSLITSFGNLAYALYFYSSGINWEFYYRDGGRSVRAVRVALRTRHPYTKKNK